MEHFPIVFRCLKYRSAEESKYVGLNLDSDTRPENSQSIAGKYE